MVILVNNKSFAQIQELNISLGIYLDSESLVNEKQKIPIHNRYRNQLFHFKLGNLHECVILHVKNENLDPSIGVLVDQHDLTCLLVVLAMHIGQAHFKGVNQSIVLVNHDQFTELQQRSVKTVLNHDGPFLGDKEYFLF